MLVSPFFKKIIYSIIIFFVAFLILNVDYYNNHRSYLNANNYVLNIENIYSDQSINKYKVVNTCFNVYETNLFDFRNQDGVFIEEIGTGEVLKKRKDFYVTIKKDQKPRIWFSCYNTLPILRYNLQN